MRTVEEVFYFKNFAYLLPQHIPVNVFSSVRTEFNALQALDPESLREWNAIFEYVPFYSTCNGKS